MGNGLSVARRTGTGAWTGLVGGFGVGIVVLMLEFGNAMGVLCIWIRSRRSTPIPDLLHESLDDPELVDNNAEADNERRTENDDRSSTQLQLNQNGGNKRNECDDSDDRQNDGAKVPDFNLSVVFLVR